MSILESLATNPEKVFSEGSSFKHVLKEVKVLLDPVTPANSILDEIHVDGLVASQVWGQVKMVVDGVSENLLFDQIPSIRERIGDGRDEQSADEASSDSEEYFTPTEEPDDLTQQQSESEVDMDGHDDYNDIVGEDAEEDEEKDSLEEEEQSEEEEQEELQKPQPDKFGLNDDFFSIDDFNKQVIAMDDPEFGQDDDEEEDVDIFGDIDDDDDEEVVMYEDFFAPEKKDRKRKRSAEDEESEDEEDDGFEADDLQEEDYDAAFEALASDFKEQPKENLSTFEKQQLEIQKEIAQLEKEQIADKKWQMSGEVNARQREHDALLDENIQFDRNAKPVPVITSEVSETIEDIIRRRIMEGQFDELEKRVITELQFKPSEKVEVSEQKSEKSLAELYEDQYKGTDGSKADEELKAAHNEISALFNNLMFKLDALSSAHFKPKNKQTTLDIKVETPTISMEDAQPLTMGNGSSLAPQEVYSVKSKIGKDEVQLRSGVVMSKEELSRQDKQRLRRAKKRKVSKK